MLEQAYPVPGLQAPVEVLVDEFGVPHLYAESEGDLFRAQGFNAARERLFQLDLWRRRGLGRLAEVFGPEFVERDRAARLFCYRGDLAAEWAAYGPGTEAIVTAFVAGINAFIELTEQRPELVPVEFVELNYRPQRWLPSDVVSIRSHGLYGNLEQEVARALTLREFGGQVEELRRQREPDCPLTVPAGLDLADLSDDVLAVYRLATWPPTLANDDQTGPALEGSNNWVIGASRSATGRPLLANDPHRAISLPSLRYLAHLSAPGLDVIGAGEPALPGISIGHNGHLGFGLTIFSIDQEDLYVYRTNPQHPVEYRYRDGWEPMRQVSETIAVAGADPVTVQLLFTRHGPVIHTDPARGNAFAVRAAWLEPGMAPYLGSLAGLRARTGTEFVAAMRHWGAPGENQVYAAPDGEIGWQAVGRAPIRPNWDGTLPVPGDGRYEWAGYYEVTELPGVANPAVDWLATANELNLPADYLATGRQVGHDWYAPFRKQRLDEILNDASAITVQDCLRWQLDTVSTAAEQVLSHLVSFDPPPELAEIVGLLTGWNRDETADSGAAALYQLWSQRWLLPALLGHALAALLPPGRVQPALDRLLVEDGTGADVRTSLLILRSLAEDPASRAELLTSSLTGALAETRALLGDDPAGWRWGRLHQVAPAHPLAGRLDQPWIRLPAHQRPGSAETVQCTEYDRSLRQTDGASFRIVIDVGDWDRCQAMNTPGQSGRPDDPHYADLYQPWLAGAAFPLYYSRAAVQAHAEQRIVLQPAAGEHR